jgi:hypothetical protein
LYFKWERWTSFLSILLCFLLPYSHHLYNSMGIDHAVTLCGNYFSRLSFLDQLFKSKNIDLREHGKCYITFCFFSSFFYSWLFNSNNIIHQTISCAMYIISTRSILSLVTLLQRHQPSSNMVSDLSFFAVKLFDIVFSYSIATRSSNIVSFISFFSLSFSCFSFPFRIIIQVKQYHVSDYLLCDLYPLTLFNFLIHHPIAIVSSIENVVSDILPFTFSLSLSFSIVGCCST